MSEKILIVEDEESLARFLELELIHEGYEVVKAYDGREGLAQYEASAFDLVLLDIMLPGLNGMEVLRRIRKLRDTPVIMLTARDTVIDKVSGLDGGADDYVTKPFDIEELLARIRVLLRKRQRQAAQTDDALTVGDLWLDPACRRVTVNEEDIQLTKLEFDLLHYLLLNKNIALSRDAILENVWGYDYFSETNVVDVYVRYLRSKIEEPFGVKYISTVRGIGYEIKDE